MSVWDAIGRRRFGLGKGVEGPPPERGIRGFVYLLATHPWKLVQINLLFVLFCLPVLTAPAALCGMNRVLVLLVRNGNCFVWMDFWKEFKASLFKSLPFGLLFAFLLVDSCFAFGISVSAGAGALRIAAAASGLALLGAAILFSAYAFVLLPVLDLPNRAVAKNSFILMATEWKTNLVILASTLLAAFAAAALFPYSSPALLLIAFSFVQTIVCFAVNEPLQRRIIGPYEESRAHMG